MILKERINKKYDILLYSTIFSIFITNLKIYIPLFLLNILYGIYLLSDLKIKVIVSKWKRSLGIFILWAILNSFIVIVFRQSNINYTSLIKIILNMSFLIIVVTVVESQVIHFNKERLIKFLELVILINFLQIIVIYFKGGLFDDFIRGSLTKSSDAAYTIGAFNNIFGGENKNIWASKFTFFYLLYLYTINTFRSYCRREKIEKIIFSTLGLLTIVLLLSRTSQIAIIIPLIFMSFSIIKNIDRKYRHYIYVSLTIFMCVALFIFFNKFFHIKFDNTDGGFTRLIIWKESMLNLFNTHFLTGNGIGHSKNFIENVVMRSESNLHNVFLNITFELGIVGILVYIRFIYQFIKEHFSKQSIWNSACILFIPVYIILNLQYLGYDNDIVCFMLLMTIINKILKRGA